MADDNKRNLHYFEAPSMRQLYEQMEAWQVEHQQRFLSLSVAKDVANYCCIALTNPTEVAIMDSPFGARVIGGSLQVSK